MCSAGSERIIELAAPRLTSAALGICAPVPEGVSAILEKEGEHLLLLFDEAYPGLIP